MRINNIVDIHAHILPGVDDGAKNITESLQILEDLKAQGVGCVYATPHFYMGQHVFSEYSKKADAAYAQLAEAAAGMPVPEIRRGYEVRIFQGISSSDEVRQMQLAGTNYLLVELPYQSAVENWMIHELYNLPFTLNLQPVIAHIERYFGVYGFERLMQLVTDGDVYTQITSSAVLGSVTLRRKLCAMLRSGQIHFIASDAHSPDTRRGMFIKANEKLAKKCGTAALLELYNRSANMMHWSAAEQEA